MHTCSVLGMRSPTLGLNGSPLISLSDIIVEDVEEVSFFIFGNDE